MNKQLWLVTALGVGLLQLWDSGAFGGGRWVGAVGLVSVLAPVVSVARGWHQRARIGALVFGAVALTLARAASSEPLNTVHLALLPVALYILVVQGFNHGMANNAA